MKKLIIGALAALLLSSCTNSEPMLMAEQKSVQVGSSEGLVRPTDYTGCQTTTGWINPPIPKNAPPNSTWYNTGSPPTRYQKDVTVTIFFEQPNKINRDAQNGKPGCTGAIFAYTFQDKKTIHLPNPCTYPQTEAYARLACHEMGHVNGWPGYHGD